MTMTIDRTRLSRLTEIEQEFGHGDDFEELIAGYGDGADDKPLPSMVLVERNTYSGGHYLSLHDTPTDAALYWTEQEEPEQWMPLWLINLDTGTRFRGVTSYTVRWE